jgi:UDP-glucuronate 4-epimerase
MAMYRLIKGVLTDRKFPLYGDGGQVRDFTYVGDVVQANLAAATADLEPGSVINIAGGSRVTLLEVIEMIGQLAGRTVELENHDAIAGDVRETGGSPQLAQRLLGWHPRTTLRKGLEAELDWMREAVDRGSSGSGTDA